MGERMRERRKQEAEPTTPVESKRDTAPGWSSTQAWPATPTVVPPTGGQALDPTTQRDMGGRFGHDFANVRVHADGQAADSAAALDARAFTVGRDIVFGAGQYQPGTGTGQHLLAHELTHVVQQERTPFLPWLGVSRPGDASEREATAIAGAVASDGPLPAVSAPPAATIQRDAAAATLSDDKIDAAIAWAAAAKLGTDATKALQTALKIVPSGTYDRETVLAVYHQQRLWKSKGKIAGPGQATAQIFAQLGLVLTHEIAAATATDDTVNEVMANSPDGITIAIYTVYAENIGTAKNQAQKKRDNQEFREQAGLFAKNQRAVGLAGGAIVPGSAVGITELEQVIETVQSIHRGLADKFKQSQPAGSDPSPALPTWTRVKNLALFSHGEDYGMGLNARNAFANGGIHSSGGEVPDPPDNKVHNPSNVKAFVQGLTGAIVSGVRVELFACLTAHDTTRSDNKEWTGHEQGERTGKDSFAATLARELGPEASVFGHTTAGHTTENAAARVFGKEAGGGAGGLQMFDLLYPEEFIQAQLEKLFPGKSPEDRAAQHDSMREQLWAHYTDSIYQVYAKKHGYPLPLGQEMFVNPDHATELLHDDWKDEVEMFDAMYPEEFIQDQLEKLFPDTAPEDEAALREDLREEMWTHYRGSIYTYERQQEKRKREKEAGKTKLTTLRYPVPMWHEMQTKPDHARELLHTDWKKWIGDHLKELKAKHPSKAAHTKH